MPESGAGDWDPDSSLGTGDNLLRRSDGGSERHEHTETTHTTPGHTGGVTPENLLRSSIKVMENLKDQIQIPMSHIPILYSSSPN